MVASELRHLYAQAMESVQGSDPLSAIRRASLMAAAGKFPDLSDSVSVPTSELELYLIDEEAAGHAVSANDAGDFLKRVQRAVARLAKARRARLADVARLFPEDLVSARLNVASASFGSLKINLFPASGIEEGQAGMPVGGPSWAEIGMVELIRALPEGPDDEESIDSLMGASPVVRRAVSDIVSRGKGEISLKISLTRQSGETFTSHLNPVQSREIRRRLEVAREERQVISLRGRLDGLRTRRQIFYFETKAGVEIHGFVEESLMEAVKQNIDREVEASMEVVIYRSQSGKASQKHYRLLAVAGVQSDIPEATSGTS